jgi:hypothetical protein
MRRAWHDGASYRKGLSMIVAFLALAAAAAAATTPAPANLPPAGDTDTSAWWATTAALSNDAMEGRDTGSAGYDRAAQLVANRFAAAGLQPMGDAMPGGKRDWGQKVALEQIAVIRASFSAGGRPLAFLHEIMVTPYEGMASTFDGPLAYRGYCAAKQLGDVRGRILICHGTRRAGLPSDADRLAAAQAAGAIGLITIADPGFTVEPPRWPFAYARTVRLASDPIERQHVLRMTLKAEALGTLIGQAGYDPTDLIAKGSAGEPLPRFDLASPLHAEFMLSRRSFTSSNVIGMLPGTDPAKAGEAIVLSAHLDGYGPGEPVNGDGMYNGTLDDAAYVALLIRLAERQKEVGKGFARPIVFAAFTGEEKGLLGARWFVDHPTIDKAKIAADINLDQLRPIFPLELLSVHAIDDTTLGDDARAVATEMGVAVQPDPEPERNLLRRADHWPFLQAGIPATGFIFGYKPGSASEDVYRRWYKTGYHRPQDDLNQPIDWKAAADFNRFFYNLVAKVADQAAAPAWKDGSKLKPVAP